MGGSDEDVPYAVPQDDRDTPRSWYYALLDYGAYLKKTIPNPSRRSSTYTRQSRFEGSRRQKRAHIVRMLLDAHASGAGALSLDEVRAGVDELELGSGRERVGEPYVASILDDLVREGFARTIDGAWTIA